MRGLALLTFARLAARTWRRSRGCRRRRSCSRSPIELEDDDPEEDSPVGSGGSEVLA